MKFVQNLCNKVTTSSRVMLSRGRVPSMFKLSIAQIQASTAQDETPFKWSGVAVFGVCAFGGILPCPVVSVAVGLVSVGTAGRIKSGNRITCPTRIKFGFGISFNRCNSATVVLCACAILERVSPLLTVVTGFNYGLRRYRWGCCVRGKFFINPLHNFGKPIL